MISTSLGVGYAARRLVTALTPAYSTGDYTAYFPDAKTNVVVGERRLTGFNKGVLDAALAKAGLSGRQ